MKNLILAVAILLSCYATQAQSLTINNNVQGDVYFTVITVAPNTCNVLNEYMEFMIPAFSTGILVDLTDPANWNGGVIPTSFDLAFAAISRDPACPGTVGWGSIAGTCTMGVQHYDIIKVGNSACNYPTQGCIEMSMSVPNCGGFVAGDVISVQYTVAGTDVTIDVL